MPGNTGLKPGVNERYHFQTLRKHNSPVDLVLGPAGYRPSHLGRRLGNGRDKVVRLDWFRQVHLKTSPEMARSSSLAYADRATAGIFGCFVRSFRIFQQR